MRVSTKLSDEKLLKLVAKSREAAFAELFERYWKILLDKALKILKQKEMAEDVVQEVFTDLWKKRTALRVDNVAAYMHTAVKYKAISQIRKNKIPLSELSHAEHLFSAYAVEDMVDYRELTGLLEDYIDKLPEKCQKVFRMSRFQHLRNREIATALNLSVKTVEKHITRATQTLKVKLNRA